MDLRKAISPILATVILIAVTLVIAIGVIGWIMGIWGSLGGPSESLVVTGGGTATGKSAPSSGENGELDFSLTIVNKGSATATLLRIEVSGIDSIDPEDNVKVNGNTKPLEEVQLKPGDSIVVKATIQKKDFTCVAGATYNVNVYTKAGNVYSTVIRVTECETT